MEANKLNLGELYLLLDGDGHPTDPTVYTFTGMAGGRAQMETSDGFKFKCKPADLYTADPEQLAQVLRAKMREDMRKVDPRTAAITYDPEDYKNFDGIFKQLESPQWGPSLLDETVKKGATEIEKALEAERIKYKLQMEAAQEILQSLGDMAAPGSTLAKCLPSHPIDIPKGGRWVHNFEGRLPTEYSPELREMLDKAKPVDMTALQSTDALHYAPLDTYPGNKEAPSEKLQNVERMKAGQLLGRFANSQEFKRSGFSPEEEELRYSDKDMINFVLYCDKIRNY